MNNKLLVNQLLEIFEQSNITFAFVVRRGNVLEVSHKQLDPLRSLIQSSTAFANHEVVFIGRNSNFKTLFFAFIHNTNRGLSQGGLRVMQYEDVDSVLYDGLRLSQGMSRKNAISDLWWGGGKGIIPITEELVSQFKSPDLKDQEKRNGLFAAYGEFVAKIGGAYYTAADIGTYNKDMQAILKTNRFVTCIPPELGGSGDPSPHTAEGVFRGIKETYKHLTGKDDLTGVKIAVQGAGKVGKSLIDKLITAGASLWVSEARFDIDKNALEEFKKEFPSAEVVLSNGDHENDIFGLDVDIISPCAVGGTVNSQTIMLLKPTVKIICGGANNILREENNDGEILYQKGIIFIPDFICNFMGIVNCANEAFGYLEEDVEKALDKVPVTVKAILEKSQTGNISHTIASQQLADDKINESVPLDILQNRGRRIIEKVTSK